MIVSDIWEEAKEASGISDPTILYRTITRACELLANEGLFDPLLGTIDFFVEGSYYVALPRDVKTPLRININNNPAFTRSRMYEFQPNTSGSIDTEDEIGWQWHDKGYSPIQDEKKLPSKLRYQVTSAEDVGKTITVIGLDEDGREWTEVLGGDVNNPEESEHAYHELRSANREQTSTEAYLLAESGPVGRYYPDELRPEYRVIKLSKTGVAVRMHYRKHVFKISAQTDILPIHSPMALLRAIDGVRMMQKSRYPEGAQCIADAVRFITKEQDSRDDSQSLALSLETINTINSNISTNDIPIVADIYDRIAEILGPVGRQKVFDRLTDALEILSNNTKWDSTLGWADVWKACNCESLYITRPRGSVSRGHGYFVLPRHVKTVEALNFCGQPTIPRNHWFEYHLNGPGTMNRSNAGTWTHCGETCIINFLPLDPDTRKVVPTQIVAIPDNSLDEDHVIRVFGIERLSTGEEVNVWRDGVEGWLVPCKPAGFQLPSGSPEFVHNDRIHRDTDSRGFNRIIGLPVRHTRIALLGDGGDDSDHADAVENMVKGFNPDEVVLLGDISYRGNSTQEFYKYFGMATIVSGFVVTIDHETGTPVPEVGSIIRILGEFFTVAAINTVGPSDAAYWDAQYQLTTFESLGGIGTPNPDAYIKSTKSLPEPTDAAMDRDVGKHWRKYIYPFVGDPDRAPLADGEVDATENHLWPVIGNHDWEEDLLYYTAKQDTAHVLAGGGTPNAAFKFASQSARNAALASIDVGTITEMNSAGLGTFYINFKTLNGTTNWTARVYNTLGTLIGTQVFVNTGGTISVTGLSITLPATTSDPATDQMQMQFSATVEGGNINHYLAYFNDTIDARYYTKVFGEAQFYFLSSDPKEEDGTEVDSVQYNWLVAQLAASTAKWQIVCLHHTPRSSGSTHAADTNHFRDWEWDTLGVDVVFAGHEHNYERWKENGVTYITAGTSNDDTYPFKTSGISAYSQKRLRWHGAIILDVSKYALKISLRGENESEGDSVTIVDTSVTDDVLLLNYLYPDEREPRYNIIQVPSCRSAKIRIKFRRRLAKITGMNDPLFLRSRVAVEKMVEALKSGDPMMQGTLMGQATKLLSDEMKATNPIMATGLQFDPGTCPAVTENIT